MMLSFSFKVNPVGNVASAPSTPNLLVPLYPPVEGYGDCQFTFAASSPCSQYTELMITLPLSAPNGKGSMILSTAPVSFARSPLVTLVDWAITSDSVTASFSAFCVDQILKVTSRHPISSASSIGSTSANSIAATPPTSRQSVRR